MNVSRIYLTNCSALWFKKKTLKVFKLLFLETENVILRIKLLLFLVHAPYLYLFPFDIEN